MTPLKKFQYIVWNLKNSYLNFNDLIKNDYYKDIIINLMEKNYNYFDFLKPLSRLVIESYDNISSQEFWSFLYATLIIEEKIINEKQKFLLQIWLSLGFLILLLIFFVIYFKSFFLFLALMGGNGFILYFFYKYFNNKTHQYKISLEKYFLLLNILSHNDIKKFESNDFYFYGIESLDITMIMEKYYKLFSINNFISVKQWIYYEINFILEEYLRSIENHWIIISQGCLALIMTNGLFLLINLLSRSYLSPSGQSTFSIQ
jgi:hypothetical protein